MAACNGYSCHWTLINLRSLIISHVSSQIQRPLFGLSATLLFSTINLHAHSKKCWPPVQDKKTLQGFYKMKMTTNYKIMFWKRKSIIIPPPCWHLLCLHIIKDLVCNWSVPQTSYFQFSRDTYCWRKVHILVISFHFLYILCHHAHSH